MKHKREKRGRREGRGKEEGEGVKSEGGMEKREKGRGGRLEWEAK